MSSDPAAQGGTAERLLDSSGKSLLLTLALAALTFLPLLGVRHLWDSDEPRVAGISSEMAREGDWVVPRLNGETFLEIPPLHWWSGAACFKVFGYGTASAKLPSALAAIAAVLCMFWLARSAGLDSMLSFTAAMILMTAPEFWVIGRRCIMDMTMCACIAAAFLGFHNFISCQRFRMPWLALFWAGLSGAALTKGIVGIGIPCSGIFFWMIVSKERRLLSWIGLFTAAALALVPTGIWLAFLNERAGWEAVRELVWTNNVGRFTGGHAEHVEGPLYYFTKFPAQFLPWTALLPLTAWLLWKRRLDESSRKAAIFSGICFAAPFLILCVAAGKRPIYLLPLYPAAALFAGSSLNWLRERLPSKKHLPLALTCLFAAYSVGLLVGDAAIMAHKNREKSYEGLFAKSEALMSEGWGMILYKPQERQRGAATFYMKMRIPAANNAQELERFLSAGPKRFALTWGDAFDELSKELPLEKIESFQRGKTVLFKLAEGKK